MPRKSAIEFFMLFGLVFVLVACQSGTSSTSPTSTVPTAMAVATGTGTATEIVPTPTVTPTATAVVATPLPTSGASATAARATGTSVTPQGTSTPSAALIAEGQQIFQTGIGPNGQEIPRSVATVGGMMGMGGMMGGAGCAACHGPQGDGEQTPMFAAPNITYRNLTDPQGMQELDGNRGPTYTDALIKRAVVSGVGADGDALDTTMPRWQMTDQEFNALLAYLKTLP